MTVFHRLKQHHVERQPLAYFDKVADEYLYQLDLPFRREDFEAFVDAFKHGELVQEDYSDDLANCVAAGRIPKRLSRVVVRR
jgi:hypothetical protein